MDEERLSLHCIWEESSKLEMGVHLAQNSHL